MNNFVPRLKQFSADTIRSKKLTLPVGIELMDLGMNTFYEMTATSIDDQGTYLFSNGRFVGEGGVRREPWSVRFTGAGEQPFVKAFS